MVCVAFNPLNGHIAASSNDGVLNVWDVATRRELETLDVHEGKRIQSLVYSPNGRFLATVGSDNHLRIGDGSTYRPVLETATGLAETAAFSHDGQLIAVASTSPHCVQIHRVVTGELLRQFEITKEHVRNIQFTHDDGSLLIVGDRTLLIDLTTGESWDPFGEPRQIWCVAVSPDGNRIATCDDQGRLQIWDSAQRLAIHRTVVNQRHCSGQRVAIAPDSKRMAILTYAPIRGEIAGDLAIWDMGHPVPKKVVTVPPRPKAPYWHRQGLAYSPDGRLLAVAADTSPRSACIQLLDTTTWSGIRCLGPFLSVRHLSFVSDGSTLFIDVLGSDHLARLERWDTKTGRTIDSMPLSNKPNVFAVAPGGLYLARAMPDCAIDLFRVGDYQKIASYGTLPESPLQLEFSHDGKLLVGVGSDGRVYVFDAVKRDLARRFSIPGVETPAVKAFALSPDAQTIALASSQGFVLAHVPSGKPLYVLRCPGRTGAVGCLAFSPDGMTLASDWGSNGDCGIYLWRIPPQSEKFEALSQP